MTPTRELALQITKECKKFAKLFNIRCVAVYGGTGISEQIVSFFFFFYILILNYTLGGT
jgi:superfamily II DNA/RNA helicase